VVSASASAVRMSGLHISAASFDFAQDAGIPMPGIPDAWFASAHGGSGSGGQAFPPR
jgi:hypothetical protein